MATKKLQVLANLGPTDAKIKSTVEEYFVDHPIDSTLIDKLCPPFSESGSVVACEPVEGYPLEVVSKIEVVQNGSGNPSPDNVRPFVGRNSIKLTRCEKNLFGGDALADAFAAKGGIMDAETGTIIFPSNLGGKYYNWFLQRFKPNTQYTFVFYGKNDTFKEINLAVWYTETTSSGDLYYEQISLSAINVDGYAVYTSQAGKTIRAFGTIAYGGLTTIYYDKCGVFEGAITLEEFEPYKGHTFTIDLGQTVYGGSLNWHTGVLSIDYHGIIFDGVSTYARLNHTDESATTYAHNSGLYPTGLRPAKNAKVYCNVDRYIAFAAGAARTLVVTIFPTYTGVTAEDDIPTKVKKFNDTLKAWYDAGTPLIAVYELETPITVQLTPQEVLALQGVNTLFDSAGNIEVTGRADPTAKIEKLQNAIIALGGNV